MGDDDALLRQAAAALFPVITQRYLKSSIVMTTHLGSWGKIFDDPTVARRYTHSSGAFQKLKHRVRSVNLDLAKNRLHLKASPWQGDSNRSGSTG